QTCALPICFHCTLACHAVSTGLPSWVAGLYFQRPAQDKAASSRRGYPLDLDTVTSLTLPSVMTLKERSVVPSSFRRTEVSGYLSRQVCGRPTDTGVVTD